jgi:hypothetical protein
MHNEHEMVRLLRAMLDRLHNIDQGIGVLNQATRNLVLTDEMILAILQESGRHSATDIQMYQTLGGIMGVIQGVHAGGAPATFAATLIPAGSQLQAGTLLAYSADDPAAVLTPAADGMSISITLPATDTAASFNLTVSGNGFDASGNAVPFSHEFNIPILTTPPPPPVSATDVDLNQTS